MNKIPYANLPRINKLQLLYEETLRLKKEYEANQKRFDDLVASIDEGPLTGKGLQDATIKLSFILDKSEELWEQIAAANILFNEAKSELVN
jgi:hypothetical protein